MHPISFFPHSLWNQPKNIANLWGLPMTQTLTTFIFIDTIFFRSIDRKKMRINAPAITLNSQCGENQYAKNAGAFKTRFHSTISIYLFSAMRTQCQVTVNAHTGAAQNFPKKFFKSRCWKMLCQNKAYHFP